MFDLFWVTSTTAKAKGSAWRLVRCEACRAEYVFLLEVDTSFTEAHFYGSGKETAGPRVAAGAAARLESLLQWQVEPVPCPYCGAYQPAMCEVIRKRESDWLATAGWFLVSGAVAACIVWGCYYSEPELEPPFFSGALLPSAIFLAAMAGCTFFLHWVFRVQCDPNSPATLEKRLEEGKRRAMTRAAFEQQYPEVVLRGKRRFGE